MGDAANIIQIVQTIPQWGIWFTICVVLTLLLVKILWKRWNKEYDDVQNRTKEVHEITKMFKDGAKIDGRDEYVKLSDIYNVVNWVHEALLENREIWGSFPEKIAQRCAAMDCPIHQTIKQDINSIRDQIKEDTRNFHANAQRVLDQFVADAAVSRANTQKIIEGVSEDVRVFKDRTLPLIQRIVEIAILNKRGESDGLPTDGSGRNKGYD